MFCLLYGPALTTVHDHWEDHSLDLVPWPGLKPAPPGLGAMREVLTPGPSGKMPTQRKLLNTEWRWHIQGHTGSEWRPEPRLPVFSFRPGQKFREAGLTNPAPASHLLPFSPLPPGLPDTPGRVGQVEEAKRQPQALTLLMTV